MANDLFGALGGLGGLVKGLSGLMPQDDPAVKLFTAQSDLSELKKQEEALYAELGRAAEKSYGLAAFGQTGEKLRLVQGDIAAAQEKLAAEKSAQEAQQAREAELVCPACGHNNPEGTKFCQECGGRLGAAAGGFCVSCGAKLAPGTRFCGECGAKQPEA